MPSDRGLSRSGVTSITTVVIRDPIRIKGSVTHLIVFRDSKVRKQSYTAKQDKGSIDLDSVPSQRVLIRALLTRSSSLGVRP